MTDIRVLAKLAEKTYEDAIEGAPKPHMYGDECRAFFDSVWERVAQAVADELELRGQPCECMAWPVDAGISERELAERRQTGHHSRCCKSQWGKP